MSPTTSNLIITHAAAAAVGAYFAAGLLLMCRDLRAGGESPLPGPAAQQERRRFARWLSAIAILAGFFAAAWFLNRERIAASLLASGALFLTARALYPQSAVEGRDSHRPASIAILLLLTAAGALLRTWAIEDYPPGFYFDEVWAGKDACSLAGGGPPLAFGQTRAPLIYFAPAALLQEFMPRCRAAIRAYPILCGIVSIPAFYCLARQLLPAAAGMAALLFVCSPYHGFYSRTFVGGSVTVMEIFSLYFLVTAITRRSGGRMALAAAGAGFLLYDYLSARLFPAILLAGLIVAWIGRKISAKRLVAYGGLLAAIVALALIPLGLMWLREPQNYYFTYAGNIQSRAQVLQGLRNCLLMFMDSRYAVDASLTNSRAQCLNPPLLALLLGGLSLSFAMLRAWPGWFVGISFLISLLPSCLSSVGANSHRAMLVIPFMYLLMGYGLQALSVALRPLAGRRLAAVALWGIVAWGAAWGVGHFLRGMWLTPPGRQELMEAWWQTSETRATEIALGLEREGYGVLTSRPAEYWEYLNCVGVNYKSAIAFRPERWLPESGSRGKSAVVLTEQVDGPVFPLMRRFATPYSWSERCYTIGGARLLIGKFDPAQGPKAPPAPSLLREGGEERLVWNGSLMLADPACLEMKAQSPGASLMIDGEQCEEGGETYMYAAGLHEVRMSAPGARRDESAAEPFFALGMRFIGNRPPSLIRLTPSSLYTVPVNGWIYTVRAVEPPGRPDHFAVAPFVFYNGVYERFPPRRGMMLREWRTRVRAKPGEILPIRVAWGRGDVTVSLDGRKIARDSNDNVISLQLKGPEEHDLAVRYLVGDYLELTVTREAAGGMRLCPPYDRFLPPIEGRYVDAQGWWDCGR